MQLCMAHATAMSSQVVFYVTCAAALGAGLIAGVCFAFSSFVLPALAGMPSGAGMLAMQAVNRRALGPYFLSAFVGTALLCAAVAADAAIGRRDEGAWLRLSGAAAYLLGVMALTRARHLVLNERLARTPAEHGEAASVWSGYVRRWTLWNDVRWLSALVASALLWQGAR